MMNKTILHGKSRIGSKLSGDTGKSYLAVNPVTNEPLDGIFFNATPEEVDHCCTMAKNAFNAYKKVSAIQRALFLDAIAEEIMVLGEILVKRASLETGLPENRIIGERGRTVLQLKLFANLIREGSWVEASIDSGDPDREPQPKPDLRKMMQPLGPVVVFTASNFPLAYSTAGGDTASALAAGNPVIVKSHPSHPGTNELVAEAVLRAAERTSMPDGVFSTLNSNGFEVGMQLVQHPLVRAVGFTGSYTGGTALWRAANEREEPIPVFSEMGSTNPVYLLEGALKHKAQSIAQTMAASITLGSGQFCTNPGLMAGIKSPSLEAFTNTLNKAINLTSPSVMLSNSIYRNYVENIDKALRQKGVSLLTTSGSEKNGANQGIPSVATVEFKTFRSNPKLHEEVFGPFSLLVICEDIDELLGFAHIQRGQLTTSVFGLENDLQNCTKLIDVISEKAGRLIFNGVPTGVEVNGSQQHGGPFPATTDSRFTSVGPDAIKRFVRPVAYQNAPDDVLPQELRNGNPLGIWRRYNGLFGKE